MSQLSEFGGDVELLAAFNMNDDTFIGVVAMSDAGAFVRADGQWHSLEGNEQAFMGSKVVTVQDQFLDLFDKMDAKGAAPTTDQALSYAVDEEDEEPVEETPEVEEAE